MTKAQAHALTARGRWLLSAGAIITLVAIGGFVLLLRAQQVEIEFKDVKITTVSPEGPADRSMNSPRQLIDSASANEALTTESGVPPPAPPEARYGFSPGG